MKKLILLLFFTAFSLNVFCQTIYQVGGHTLKYYNGSWTEIIDGDEINLLTNLVILKFDQSLAQRDIDLLAKTYDIRQVYSNARGFYTFDVSGSNYVSLLTSLFADHSVVSVELNHKIQLMTPPNDSYDLIYELVNYCGFPNLLWPYNYIELFDAWELSTGNPSITVAIIDNGLYVDHEDLTQGPDNYSNIWVNLIEKNGVAGTDDDGNGKIDDFFGWDFIDDDNSVMHDHFVDGHGTRIAGIIGAKSNNEIGVYGIAGGSGNEGIKLMGLKVSGSGYIQSAAVSQAIDYAVENGAKIINMSFGGSTNYPSWQSSVEYAYSENVILVASAGNYQCDSQNGCIMYPAKYDEVIAVGATTANFYTLGATEARWNPVGEFESAKGPELEIMAPGVAFTTDYSENPYNVYHSEYDFSGTTCIGSNPVVGTSKASAFVTGVIALMVSANPCLTNDDVRDILMNTNDKIGGPYDPNGHSDYMGYGRINARAALEASLSGSLTSITSNTTWNTNRTLYYNVEIESGATLTIQNCTVLASQLVKIIVKPGGKLIIDNSTITSLCDHQWQGIEVWGNHLQHQWPYNGTSYYQGYVKIDHSTISNAICAFNLWKPGDYTKTGGILIADASYFTNNTQAIRALNYKNFHPVTLAEMDYQAVIDDCKFEIKSDYNGDYRFYKHVDLARVRGVRFKGSDFSLSPTAPNVDNYNHGIAAYDAGFSANAVCRSTQIPCPEADYDKCTFSGFHHAISANNISTSNTFYVNRAVFDNNVIGIQINLVKNFIVVNSSFGVGSTTRPDCSYGIYMESSTGFSIEENTFNKKTGALCNNTVGIFTRSTRGIDDIYKNDFNGLTSGNYAKEYNYMTNYWTGLEFLCNENTGNFSDFYVEYMPLVDGDAIQARQGNRCSAAGNTFSPNATWHFYNGGDYLVGYYYRNVSNEIPDINKIYGVTRELATVQPADFCVSHYGTGDPKEKILLNDEERLQEEYNYATASLDYNGVESLYNNLIDGGSTEMTMSEVNQATPESMLSVKNDLLLSSPHLSEEVLMLVSQRTEVFPDIAIFDILAANPDELKKEELLIYLEEKENPLPDYMIEILRQVATGTSYKTVLQEEMNKHSHLKVRAANSIIRSILNSEFVNYEDLRNWLDNLGSLEADRQIINSYLTEDNYTAALNLAGTLAAKYNLSGIDLEVNDAYLSCLNLVISLESTGRDYSELTFEEISFLEETIAGNLGYASDMAKSIKTRYNSISNCDCPIIEESNQKSGIINTNKLASDYGFSVSVNPNPASKWITFNYTLPLNETSGVIEIKDLNGKSLKTISLNGNKGQAIWDVSDLPSCQLIYYSTSGGFITSGKIIIVK